MGSPLWGCSADGIDLNAVKHQLIHKPCCCSLFECHLISLRFTRLSELSYGYFRTQNVKPK